MADYLVSKLSNISSLGNGDQFIVTDDSDSDKVKNITYSNLRNIIADYVFNDINTSGTRYNDNVKLYFGTGNDVEIYYNPNGNFQHWNFKNANGVVFEDNGVDKIVIEDSGIIRPATDGTGSIGSSTRRWDSGHFENLIVSKDTGNNITLETSVDNGNDSTFIFQKSRGGSGGASQITNNDSIGEILWKAYNDSQYKSAGYLKMQAGTVTTSDLNARMIFGIAGSGEVLVIQQTQVKINQDLTVSGDINSTSDIRLKDNIKPLENSLEKVKQLRGVEYDRNDTKSHQIGVIAQEVEKIYPDFVSENEDGIKSVSYGQMVSVLIEAIKDLSEEVDTLKSIINN